MRWARRCSPGPLRIKTDFTFTQEKKLKKRKDQRRDKREKQLEKRDKREERLI